jgi:hypothetical protein
MVVSVTITRGEPEVSPREVRNDEERWRRDELAVDMKDDAEDKTPLMRRLSDARVDKSSSVIAVRAPSTMKPSDDV